MACWRGLFRSAGGSWAGLSLDQKCNWQADILQDGKKCSNVVLPEFPAIGKRCEEIGFGDLWRLVV